MLKYLIYYLTKVVITHNYEAWQVPPVEVNIKPLGHEVGSITAAEDKFMSYNMISVVDEKNIDKIADISFLTDFTEV